LKPEILLLFREIVALMFRQTNAEYPKASAGHFPYTIGGNLSFFCRQR
jgi:hypothetical protein